MWHLSSEISSHPLHHWSLLIRLHPPQHQKTHPCLQLRKEDIVMNVWEYSTMHNFGTPDILSQQKRTQFWLPISGNFGLKLHDKNVLNMPAVCMVMSSFLICFWECQTKPFSKQDLDLVIKTPYRISPPAKLTVCAKCKLKIVIPPSLKY